ncbi:MAG: hypothetical protein ACREOH_06330 [Candidatus Entotheonellia bacterium]
MSGSQGNVRRICSSREQSRDGGVREYLLGLVNGRGEHEKVEVVLSQAEDGTCEVKLILQSWGEGIGWYPQKTIALDLSQIGPLQRALGMAKGFVREGQPQEAYGGAILILPPLSAEER